MRPDRPEWFMEIASVVAKRSTCMRLNVGAIIVHNRRIVSIGYNGVPSGLPHCTGNDCPGKAFCTLTVHAEVNAIKHLTVDRGNLDMYVTDSPCPECAFTIRHAGIRRVFYRTLYRIADPVWWLEDEGIETYRVTPAGYVLDANNNLVEVET